MTRAALLLAYSPLLTAAMAVPPAAQQEQTSLRVLVTQALADYETGQRISDDQPGRARELFRSSANRFRTIADTGVTNGRLEFNLGNCYLQAGDLGHAILHYRRAQRLIPRDPLLADNLSVARSRRLTNIPPSRGSAILRNIFFWHYETSVPDRARTAILLYITAWLLLTLRVFLPRRGLTIATIFFAFLTLTLASSIGYSKWSERNAPQGVVTAMDVVVYKGPDSSYQRLFEQPLQPGVEFTRHRKRGQWWRIQLPDGKTGWIEASSSALINDPQK